MTKYRLIAFDTVLYNILVPELEKHGFHRRTSWWMRNWLDGYTERVVVNGSMCKGRPVTSDVLRGQYWDQHSLTSLPGTQTVGSSAPSARWHQAVWCHPHAGAKGSIQRNLDRWTCANLTNLNRAEYKIPHLGWSNPDHKYALDGEWIESSSKKGFRVLLSKQLNLWAWPATCAHNAESQLNPGLHPRQRDQQGKEGDSPCLLCSGDTLPGVLCPALTSPTQEGLWPVGVQRAAKMIRGLERVCYEDRLGELELCNWRREGSGDTLEQTSNT